MFMPVASSVSPSFGVIAERHRRAGQLDRAVSLCREGLAVFPDYLAARVTLGYALMEQGLEREAHRELRAVLERAPDNLAAIRGLAELHSKGVEESDAHAVEFAAMDPGAEAVMDESPLLLAGGELTADDERRAITAPAALDAVTLPMFAVAAGERVGDVAQSIDPVMEPRALEPLALEPLDPPIAPEISAPILIESFDGFDDSLAPAMDHDVRLAGFGCEDVDPALEPVVGEPLQFEIEDVIDAAEEPPSFVLDEAFDEPVDLLEPGQPDETAAAAQPAVVSAEPVPVPELSAGPIALLDEWLTRIRARRSELLSEYAAG